MDSFTKQFVNDIFPRTEPKTYAACYPRRIAPVPPGFVNPKYFAAVLRSELLIAHRMPLTERAHSTGVLHLYKQLEYGVPTYFVRSDFAQAVAQTNPPEDFKFGEILWPLDAMLFTLPTDFVLKYFGCLTPFISVCRAQTGDYPDCVKLPPLDLPLQAFQRLHNPTDRFIVVAPCYSQFDVPFDYTGLYNMAQPINVVPGSAYSDASYLEEQMFGITLHDVPDRPTGEADRLLQNKLILYAIKLMLAITARPHVLKHGELTRKASIAQCKRKKEREALWSPNTIGWEYRAAKPSPGPGTGTHTSPRLHWRVGHFTHQPYGEKMSLRKLIWLAPILVNAPEQ